MPIILTNADFASVRALIGAGANARSLPNATLSLDVFKGEAEREVSSLTDNTGDEAKRAAIYFLAARALPTIPVIKSQKIGDDTIEHLPVNPAHRAAELRATALEIIAAINAAEAEATTEAKYLEDRPRFFGTARAPYRR